MNKCPVIFLAFANDHQDYLYKLTEEQNSVRKALEKMEDQGLCKVVYETDTDLDKIWATFNKFQDRIAIFHYGGHADDYSLLLKKANGERQIAQGEGLVPFLGQQKGLQLVFINGCCSKLQAEEIRDQGVPAVIGTSVPINDEAATILSGGFYQALAAGRSIEQAWISAKTLVLSQKKEKGFKRGIKIGAGYTLEFPWEMYIRRGAEHVRGWNLPHAGSNPLFGLDLPDSAYLRLDIKAGPYVGLRYFRQEDAPLFYGRGAQIRTLYNHLKGIYPIILLYGRSGVGKSSMLDAGLLPRIKDEFQITYVRRNQEKGLLGTLDLALDELLDARQAKTKESTESTENQKKEALNLLRQAADKMGDERFRQRIEGLLQDIEQVGKKKLAQLTGILKKWQQIEQFPGTAQTKPLVVILDQVEEKFTRPMPVQHKKQQEDELLAFLLAIKPLFTKDNSGIEGKLILSYRKEYHPEIKDAFESLSLPFDELFLKRLNREGIIEAIQGIALHDRINEDGTLEHNTRYNPFRLELERTQDGYLPEIIADDLMEDPESPIAPVLQIILKKLWQTAPKAGDSKPVRLGIGQYRELRKKGTTMGEFFREQMGKLTAESELEQNPEKRTIIKKAVESGLVLDLLHAHTTTMGTAGSCRRSELLDRYEIAPQVIELLLAALKELSLLIELHDETTPEATEGNPDTSTILAHDTLAPAVIQDYNLSDAPGQRAARILANKMADVGFQLEPTVIEDWKTQKLSRKMQATDWAELKKEQVGFHKFLALCEDLLGPQLFKDWRRRMWQQARINFFARDNEVLLEDADLDIVEKGTHKSQHSFPGMRKLEAPEQELVQRSQEKRAQREKKELEEREEKERIIQARLDAQEEAKKQAEVALKAQQEANQQAQENLQNQQRAAKKQRSLIRFIGFALLIAIGLGLWALDQRRDARSALRQNIEQQVIKKTEELEAFGDGYQDLKKWEFAQRTYEQALDTLKNLKNNSELFDYHYKNLNDKIDSTRKHINEDPKTN